MTTKVGISCRQVEEADRQHLANLIHFEPLVHRHLDWRAPLDWMGFRPFLAAEQSDRLVAALACPPDPSDVAWIRLFAVASNIEESAAWWSLWPQVSIVLDENNIPFIGAIPLQHWFTKLLKSSGFKKINEVILMLWENGSHRPSRTNPEVTLRPMNKDDLPEIEQLDARSFGPIWHNSKSTLDLAYRQAVLATVVEIDGLILGYQISTAMQRGGHLARLAVDPDFQRRGIGAALMDDLLTRFERRGATQVTVNTQRDNFASIALYERFKFKRTGEAYPVYQYIPAR